MWYDALLTLWYYQPTNLELSLSIGGQEYAESVHFWSVNLGRGSGKTFSITKFAQKHPEVVVVMKYSSIPGRSISLREFNMVGGYEDNWVIFDDIKRSEVNPNINPKRAIFIGG